MSNLLVSPAPEVQCSVQIAITTKQDDLAELQITCALITLHQAVIQPNRFAAISESPHVLCPGWPEIDGMCFFCS